MIIQGKIGTRKLYLIGVISQAIKNIVIPSSPLQLLAPTRVAIFNI
jgi:hypothetical protein